MDEQTKQHPIIKPRPGLYLVSRTSGAGDDDRPCHEAFEVLVKNIDTRTCDDPKKIPANHGTDGDWYKRGTNHRIVNGRITRDIGFLKEWAVEIDDLLAFVEEYGPCIVDRNDDGFYTIEIYDGYRE